MSPLAIRNNRLYPICPAAPVTATRTGAFIGEGLLKWAIRLSGIGGVDRDRGEPPQNRLNHIQASSLVSNQSYIFYKIYDSWTRSQIYAKKSP
jgi:hypothetical protein